MKKFFFALLVMLVTPVYASHIVGGEFELIHLSGYNYQLNMILYFDDINGNPGALDQSVTVSFYRKIDNAFMTNLTLPLLTRDPVSYTQPACSTGLLQTDRIYYSATITLSPNTFSDPAGYYISWQRCCRNYNITNIFSDVPGTGTSAGQTFYLEFPPVVKNGVQFINSSPHLFPPLSDYGCPGRPYYVNFAGIDDDNDSIVYSLTTPLNTTSSTAIPPASPAPYPLVEWRPGYSLDHIMNGSPDLRISPTGLLTCTPVNQGLFVFAVKAEEFRNGEKIGETRRDFQMLVVDGCQPDQPPLVVGKKKSDATFTYVNTMNVSFADTVKNNNRCITVRVSDPDSKDAAHNFTQNVSIRAVALNFKKSDLSSILPSVKSATLVNGSTVDFQVCFPQCPFINAPYQIGLIAMDDACSLPMTDTLKVTINQQPPPNSNAYFVPPKTITATLNEGETGSWPFVAKDDDGDALKLFVITDGFLLSNAGMTYSATQEPGIANGSIAWNAFCKNYEFSKKNNFTIKILVDDQDVCNIVHYDTALYKLNVVLPAINPKLKIYDENRVQDLTNGSIEVPPGHIGFDLLGTDTDVTILDTLSLSLLGATGTIAPSGYDFANATGLHLVESKFSWDPTCSIFKNGSLNNDYKFQFIVANHHCKTPKTDTAYVKVSIKDVESTDTKFLPPNVITTYPDHCNDFFAIDGFDGEPDCSGQSRVAVNAPVDNCSNRFESVRIYDRWGKLVFTSADRKFRWYALNESAGVYYYLIQYTNKQYKSSLTVIH
ncbi:MAG: gliding motility-associated C-terminal domain-containing protein [Bacteroidetes bacterium]|nr:gliding motility-associated C-terminal domain-containing protein [Bacteroidota bacterium]